MGSDHRHCNNNNSYVQIDDLSPFRPLTRIVKELDCLRRHHEKTNVDSAFRTIFKVQIIQNLNLVFT